MIYAYLRVSTDKQDIDNQKYEILKFADSKNLKVQEWILETVSGTKKVSDRQLGQLLEKLKSHDILIVTELSRLGRSLMEVMSILHDLMQKPVKVFAIKNGYELADNIQSKVLAFGFSIAAEIEREFISSRTRAALQRRKSEGQRLGRPQGRLSKITKLTGKEETIQTLLNKKVSVSAIARILNVNRLTLAQYIKSRSLT